MPYRLRLADLQMEAEIVARRPQLLVRINGVVHSVAERSSAGNRVDLVMDDAGYRGWRCANGNEAHVRLNGITTRVCFEEALSPRGRASAQQEIRADMPGIVIALYCEAGQALRTGDKLLTMESMKLQVTLVAAHEAIVDCVHVAPDSVFERGALLVSFARME